MVNRETSRKLGAFALAVVFALAACTSDDGSSSSPAASTTAAAASETTVAAATTVPTTDAPDTVPATEPATTLPETTPARDTTIPATTAPPPTEVDDETLAGILADLDAAPPGCDPLDTRNCLLPFPSNFNYRDGHVELPIDGMPENVDGVRMDPTEWNRNDGFSPSTPILTYVEGLDAEASHLPSWTDLEASFAEDATVVVVDIGSGHRVPLWAELDARADDDGDRLLEIHPAVALAEGHTYVVGLSGLVDVDGDEIGASPTFRAYRDGLITELVEIEGRRDEMESGFDALETAGIERSSLQLAWTFTVATEENIAGRMLHIRDDALANAGNEISPPFTVTSVTPNTDDNIALQIAGTFTVPNYLTADGSPGNRFYYGDGVIPTGDELPVQNGTLEARFLCNVSVATMSGNEPAHLVQYGHGLLGSEREINAGNVRAFANEHNVVFCATKWAGMSEDDIGNAVATLAEMGRFPTMADRLQQGVLNQIFLGRLMTGDGGLATIPELTRADGTSMVDVAHLDYDGNSQGGIMGSMLAAVSPDIERAVVGVTGQNYSLLLSRSVDFATYEAIFEPAYPNDLDREMIIAIVQMLWDRGEGAGYIQHITHDPYEDTPAKEILLHVAFGDWQVTELSAMVAARTMGVPIHRPVTADGRSEEVEPGWGLETITYPSDGSGLVVWDSGSAPIPVENVPPSTGRDPHEDVRADIDVRRQKASFLFDDTLIDVCDRAACTADQRD